jgi:hypothetical protein
MRKTRVYLGVCIVLCAAMIGCTSPTAAPTATAPPPTSPPVSDTATAASPAPADVPAMQTPAPPPPSETVWKADGVIDEGEYPHTVEAAGVVFHWANDDENLYAAMAAETGGWVAVGFDPEMRMQGANYVVGYVKDGEAFIQDMFGVKPAGLGSHPADVELGGSDDVLEYGGQEEGGRTVIEFKIPLDSGDPYDKPLSPGERYDLITAMGSGDDFDSLHIARGYGEITIDE